MTRLARGQRRGVERTDKALQRKKLFFYRQGGFGVKTIFLGCMNARVATLDMLRTAQ